MNRDNLILITDKREKTPLTFPEHLVVLKDTDQPTRGNTTTVRITSERRTITEGDYALAGYEHLGLVERKAHMKEVLENCLTEDRTRFISCLERLAGACRYPLLLLEGDPFYLLSPDAHCKDPFLGFDALTRLLATYRISWAIVSTNTPSRRRVVGEMVARYLISCACNSVPQESKPSPSPA